MPLRASPNQDPRPPGTEPELIVVHCISLPPGQFGGDDIDALFLNRLDATAHPDYASLRGLRVSAHLLIRRDGATIQYVPFNRAAWHAGLSCWRGREGCNAFSIGIELEGTDTLPFADAQYEALAACIRALREHYPSLQTDALVGHSDIAPGRKTDPGSGFDWARLQRLLETDVADG